MSFSPSFTIAAAIGGILLSSGSVPLVFFFVGLMAVCYGVTFPIYGACAGDYFSKHVIGTVIGAWTPFYGLGAIASHWLGVWLGMLGMHGTFRANMAVSNADVLFAVGARFDDRVTGKISGFAPKARIIHIDVDPTSISKNVPVDIPIVGDCKDALTRVLTLAQANPIEDLGGKRAEWLNQIHEWAGMYPLTYKEEGDIIKPQYVVEKLYELSKGEAIVTTEVGQNQMWAAQYYHFARPRSFLSSGGLGTMGYGLPAAIGAQVAFPDRLVIDVAGDGSIQMNIQELITAVNNCLTIKVGGKGYARDAVEELIRHCGSETIHIHSTIVLIPFYKTLGFVPIPENQLPRSIKERFLFCFGEMMG